MAKVVGKHVGESPTPGRVTPFAKVATLVCGTDTHCCNSTGVLMARRPESVAKLHRDVGAALAAYIEASPLSQSDLKVVP